jgi:hypothetical protein
VKIVADKAEKEIGKKIFVFVYNETESLFRMAFFAHMPGIFHMCTVAR